MGGHKAGDVASKIAIETLKKSFLNTVRGVVFHQWP